MTITWITPDPIPRALLAVGGLLLALLAPCAAAPLPLVLPLLMPPAAPPAARNGPDNPPAIINAGFGALTIRAAAVESEDFSGYRSAWGEHPPRVTKDGWTLTGPQNMDNHLWTGAPAIRLLLSARNVSHDTMRQDWTVEIDRVTPQWGPPVPFRQTPRGRSSESFPAYNPQNLQPGETWVTHDWQIGAGRPGRQHWVKVDGWALRSAWRTETLTLHDAEVVHDASFGGDRIVWRQPETVTTPSGISVTTLNGQPGVPDVGAVLPGASVWRFDGGSAEMLLAWRLPPGIASQEHAAFNDPAEANPPRAVGTLASEQEWSPAPVWDALAAPGAQDAGALEAAGYGPLRFSLRSNVWPSLPPPSARQEGLFMLRAVPLPPLIKTITFQISLREEQERHPFHLWVPVRAAFPPGWDAGAADSRFRH